MDGETCTHCGHPADWRRHDDTDTTIRPIHAWLLRCIGYDCMADGPPPPGGRACDCPDFVAPSSQEEK